LCKNNAATWYNKTCKAKQLIPSHTNVKGDNLRCQRTKNVAIRYRINQELKFQYAKKQKLNGQFYRIHLECASLWPTTWHLIQLAINNSIQQQMDRHYKHLNKKLDQLLKKPKRSTQPQHKDDCHFYT